MILSWLSRVKLPRMCRKTSKTEVLAWAEETADFINAVKAGSREGLGLGYAVAKEINKSNLKHKK